MTQTYIDFPARARPRALACLLAVAALASSICAAPTHALAAPAAVMREAEAELKAGDILIEQTDAGWSALKVLEVDTWPGGTRVVHCLLYAKTETKPDLATVVGLPILIGHAPIAAAGVTGERLGNVPVSDDEKAGFLLYLKETDFPRYLAVTGQDPEAVIAETTRHYERGNALAKADDHEGAIVEYDKAIEIFPLFFEAIDNRAFSNMDLGRYDVALTGFEESLRLNPDGLEAFFSRGECLMRLGRLDEALVVFEEGRSRFPKERKLFEEFHGRVLTMRQAG